MIAEEWSNDYSDQNLNTAIDTIMREWQELTGINFYDLMFELEDFRLYDETKLRALDVSYRIKNTHDYAVKFMDAYGADEELEQLVSEIGGISEGLLADFKFKSLKSVNDITQKYKQIEGRLENTRKENEEKKNKNGVIVYEDLLVPIEIHFKKDIIYDITCAKYASYLKRMRKNG